MLVTAFAFAACRPAAPERATVVPTPTVAKARRDPVQIPALELTLLWVSPGAFTLGNPAVQAGQNNNEGPATWVTLTQGFWLGRTEVTQRQWMLIMDANPSGWHGPERPVNGVSWTEAREFCCKLTTREEAAGRLPAGFVYSLPSEAQWEYACRAGCSEPSVQELPTRAWCGDLAALHGPQPVGTKTPNAWGFCDLQGNVAEWCVDRLWDYPGGELTDPVGDSYGLSRVSRGGSWQLNATLNRIAARRTSFPGESFDDVGLRIALVNAASVMTEDQRAAQVVRQNTGLAAPKIHLVADLDLALLWIAPGTLTQNETPPRRLDISRGYWLGRTEVTQAQWSALMERNPSQFKGSDHPVENLTWADAMEFCRRLNDREGAAGRLPARFRYTLPTEAQWEYACRAGTPGGFAGDFEELAWCAETLSAGGEGHRPVAQKSPNPWGFFDMHGNVWEWCLEDTVGLAPAAGSAAPARKVLRGGSWQSPVRECRAASRDEQRPGNRANDRGFRLALVEAPTEARRRAQ